ncbi:tetratricopeptide repeat protein [Micromonospora sp. AMSO31t]|uniref:tetratricopeptide repeat protein n=1 Tax=Micromonospora sp. AMSO31t TaxID=2650566 RepID=UPI001788D7C2|nr:tetratricopeptide repeat protein [Micromonospora sp. AMSO31t]
MTEWQERYSAEFDRDDVGASGSLPPLSLGVAGPWRLTPIDGAAPPIPPQAALSYLLSARYRVVPFLARGAELDSLTSWRDGGPSEAARLVHAPGGHGKTRLADRFAALSRKAGWTTTAAAPYRPGTPGRRHAGGQDMVVIDYAERWPMQDLVDLMTALHDRSKRLRVLLLSRYSGTWWQILRAELTSLGVVADPTPLPPIALTPELRRETFVAARDAFAERLELPPDMATSVATPPYLGDGYFSRALTLHMAALVAVHAATTGQLPPADQSALSRYLLDRERLHWHRLHAKGHAAPGVDGAVTVAAGTMARLVYVATTTGPLDHDDARKAVTAALEDPSAADRMLRDHRVCYPPAEQRLALEPLYPDLLGEDFVALMTLGHQVAAFEADPWATDAPMRLVGASNAAPPWTPRLIATLAEAARRWPHLATEVLNPLLRLRPELAALAGGPALAGLLSLPGLEPPALEAVRENLAQRGLPEFHPARAIVTERLTDYYLGGPTIFGVTAIRRGQSGVRHAIAGNLRRALVELTEAVDEARELARILPNHHGDEALAGHLLNLAGVVTQIDRLDEAETLAREALALARQVAERDPHTRRALARALTNTAIILRRRGQLDNGLRHAEEAEDILRDLASTDPQIEEDYAQCLMTIAASHQALGNLKVAGESVNNALQTFTRLDGAYPGRYRDRRARALLLTAELHFLSNQPGEAARALFAAVPLLRPLAAAMPATYERMLALTLRNLGTMLMVTDRPTEAIEFALEAIDMGRKFRTVEPHEGSAELAQALITGSGVMASVERDRDSLAFIEEAVRILEDLSTSDPRHDRSLEIARGNLKLARKRLSGGLE